MNQLSFNPEVHLYHYKAKILRVYDGDTVAVKLELGLYISRIEKLRLAGINTPEVVGAQKSAGMSARNTLIDLLYRGNFLSTEPECIVQTIKDRSDKYGRLLANIFVKKEDSSTWLCVNDEMIALGQAKPWTGEGLKP